MPDPQPAPERAAQPTSGSQPALEELFRQEAEGLVDRLDLLLNTGTAGAAAEGQRLAHHLKGLAASTGALSLRDLARSVEAALTRFRPEDEGRRAELLSAVDALRAMLAGDPRAAAAARSAAAALAKAPRGVQRPGVPWARRALLRRIVPELLAAAAACRSEVAALERGRDKRDERHKISRELELWAGAAGLLGQAGVSALGLALVGFLERRNPSTAGIAAAREALRLLEHLCAREDEVDQDPGPEVLSLVEGLQPAGQPTPEEQRIPLTLELPWPDVDLPVDLAVALQRATSGRRLLDARPARPNARFLRGTLGLAPRGRHQVDEGPIQVPRRRLDQLLGLSEELVAMRGRARGLDRLAAELLEAAPAALRPRLRRLSRATAELDRDLDHLARAMQESVLRTRLVPLRGLFALARVTVREYLSRHPDKAVDLELDGAATKVDKGVQDALVEPVLQLLKNALEHGLEPRLERARLGKPERGRIRLSARAGPTGVLLEVEDDGRGLDLSRLQRAGEERGLLLLRTDLDPALALAFAPGISTAERVTDDAGSGVGLVGVLERVRALRGRLAYTSHPGVGTLARVAVPPAATTARVLLVRVGGERYALPMTAVHAIEEAGQQVSRAAALVRLADLVDAPPPGEERRRMRGTHGAGPERRRRDRFVVLVEPPFSRDDVAQTLLGCVVDDVLRRDLVVVRPLGRRFAPPGVDGAALLGDGRVVLVLDPWRLYTSQETRAHRLPGEAVIGYE